MCVNDEKQRQRKVEVSTKGIAEARAEGLFYGLLSAWLPSRGHDLNKGREGAWLRPLFLCIVVQLCGWDIVHTLTLVV